MAPTLLRLQLMAQLLWRTKTLLKLMTRTPQHLHCWREYALVSRQRQGHMVTVEGWGELRKQQQL